MGKEYRTRTFKSGNSVAMRLPKAMGIAEGIEMIVREEAGSFTAFPAEPERKTIDISGFAGKAPWLKPLPPELREFEERPSTIAARKRAQEES